MSLPRIATLLGGLIQWYTGGQTILAGISQDLIAFGSDTWLGLPRVVYVVVVVEKRCEKG